MRAACGKTVPLIMAAFADICGCATCGAVKLRGSRGWATKRTPLCLWMADSWELNILGGLCMALFRGYCGYDRWDSNIPTRGFRGMRAIYKSLGGIQSAKSAIYRRDSGETAAGIAGEWSVEGYPAFVRRVGRVDCPVLFLLRGWMVYGERNANVFCQKATFPSISKATRRL